MTANTVAIRATPAWSIAPRLLLFALCYVAAYIVGIDFYYKSADASTVWIANGITMAVLILEKRSVWPAFLGVACVTHLLVALFAFHTSLGFALDTAFLDQLEALAAAYVITRFLGSSIDLCRLRDTLTIVASLTAVTGLVAVLGAWIVVTFKGHLPFYLSWRLWWGGDLLGAMIIVPTVIGWRSLKRREINDVRGGQFAEGILIVTLCLFLVAYGYAGAKQTVHPNYMLPILIWASMRFHPRFVATVMLICVCEAVYLFVHDPSPVPAIVRGATIHEAVIQAQAFLLVVGASMLVVASITGERERVIALHKQAETDLRTLASRLEQRVEERTHELATANEELQDQIAERRRAEENLQERNDELKSFAYTVSHDLKAPLRGIAGYAQELERKHKEGLTERASFCLSQIMTAARNLDNLIEDLLKYSRLDSQATSFSHVNLAVVIDRILTDRHLAITEARAKIDMKLDVTEVYEWERGLQQVLTNLIDNALKYARDADPPKITITSRNGGPKYIIGVADNGIGFDMKYHDRLFGLFNRLVRTEEYEGTGAGLAIAKKLVEKRNGRIWAESSVGQGSVFYVEYETSPGAESTK